MKVFKACKKTVSFIMVLGFLMTLFPLALPAFAGDYERLGALVSVGDDTVVELNRVKIEFSQGELEEGDEVIISLPCDFEFCKEIPANNPNGKEVMEESDWVSSSDNRIEINLDSGGIAGYHVSQLDDNEIKLTIDDPAVASDDVNLFMYLGAVYVEKGYEGDISLRFDAPSGSGFEDGEVVVGRVSSGEVEVEVVDRETFSEKGEVTIRMTEDRAGAFEDGEDSVKFVLPDGFVWDDDGADGRVIYGDDEKSINLDYEIEDEELSFHFDEDWWTQRATCIEVEFTIVVDDQTEAKPGDIVAKVKGESNVTPSTIIVGAYGDYDFEVTASDPTTVYAGQVEQEVADFAIEEVVAGSLVDGRTITLTLPEWAKWGSLPETVSDGVTLNLVGFPGKDGQVARYEVVGSSSDPADLDFKDMEVVLSPKAPMGDLTVKLGGSAGVEGEVKVADVAMPFVLRVSNVPTMAIGTAGQSLGEITITEAEAGLISKDRPLVLILPKDIPWEDYEVEVIQGDLEIGDCYDRENPSNQKNYLYIDIKDDSNEASVIKVTALVTAFRSVPEGRVLVGMGGPAVIGTQDPSALIKQYGSGIDGYFQIAGLDVVKTDEIYPVEDIIGGGVASIIGTPAPDVTQLKAVFTLGATSYTLNDVNLTMDAAPYTRNGRTYLPVRYVAKALGIAESGILWNYGKATFISADKVVSVKIGSTMMTINGAAVPIDAAPEIVNGRTMLPIKWIATAFNVDVSWDASTQSVTVQ